MTETASTPFYRSRLFIFGLVAVAIVLGFALVVRAIGDSNTVTSEESVNVLANSNNECVVCHTRTTPGIVDQYGHSTMAAAEVSCQDCHSVDRDYPGAVEHEDGYVLTTPTTAMCAQCHDAEVAQFNASRHGLPAYVAYAGTEVLSEELLAVYRDIPETEDKPDRSRNQLYHLEGEAVTRFACEGCHNIGQPKADGSVGECQQCHLRHEFSLEQARKPETCNHCHIGPDHPQYEIYTESQHGIDYHTGGHNWN